MIWHPVRSIALVALALSLGALAGPVAWRMSGEPIGLESVDPVSGVPPSTADPMRPDISAIAATNPFGALIVPAEIPVILGESDLGLVLVGVMLANPPTNSRAMIADTSAVAKSHAIGAEVAPGVTIQEIYGDHIVLSVKGALQTLSFPNAQASQVSPEGKTDAVALTSGVAALNQLIPTDVNYSIPTPEEATDAESVIARYRAAIRQNPLSVMLRLGIEATDDGYVVTDKTSQGVLNAGFRPGDVIKTVNGKAVGNVQSDVELFDQIAEAGLAQVELIRGGQEMKLTFPLR